MKENNWLFFADEDAKKAIKNVVRGFSLADCKATLKGRTTFMSEAARGRTTL